MFNIIPETNWFFVLVMTILGLLIGSFLNVVIYRLPIMMSQQTWQKFFLDYLKQNIATKYKIFNLLLPPSHCTKCKKQLLWWHNIPVVSYFLLGGKCGNCKTPIHWRYPAVEILTCFTTLVVALQFGTNIQTIFMLILTWSLITIAFIDYDHLLIPDNITLPLIWLGLLLNTNNWFASPESAIIGAISGYFILWLIAFVFKLIRKMDGIGHGDFKLFAVFGAWLGWQMLPIILLAASLLGSIVGISLALIKKRQINKPLPFGPYLAIAGWLTFFWGQDVLNWYLMLLS